MTYPAEPVIVDTNVVVYAVLNRPEAERFRAELHGRFLMISFQSVAELWHIAFRRQWGVRVLQQMEEHLGRLVVLYPDEDLLREWGELMSRQRARGSRISSQDAWVAAAAIRLGCPVITNDRKDFERIEGLRLLP